jgi:hypothetical protein
MSATATALLKQLMIATVFHTLSMTWRLASIAKEMLEVTDRPIA